MTATLLEQLRTFHITGHGLAEFAAAITVDDFDAAPLPAEPADFCAGAAIAFPISALLAKRGPLRTQFTEQLRQVAERLEDLLALDDSHAAGAVSKNNLGAAAQYFRVDNLDAVMRRRANPVLRKAPERRERCQHALATLRQALAIVHPPFTLFHQDGHIPDTLHGDLHVSADPCAAALDYALNQLHAITPALKALRVARLDLDDAYDPPVHDPILHRFRWEAAGAGELAAQSPVIAVLTAAQAAATSLCSFTRLLRSGCPVLLIVTQPAFCQQDLACDAPDFAQLAMTYRDAFILQSSLGAPEHFRAAVDALAKTLRPALAVVATPSGGGWAESVILAQSAASPLFTFDPAAGPRFRDCLHVQPPGPNPWTAAHAVALNPAVQSHFRRIPLDTPERDTFELSEYLRLYEQRAPLAIPVLTLRSRERVAISRDVAEYCHDRQQARSRLAEWGAAAPAPEPGKIDSNEAAMREAAQRAFAQAIALVTKEGGKS